MILNDPSRNDLSRGQRLKELSHWALAATTTEFGRVDFSTEILSDICDDKSNFFELGGNRSTYRSDGRPQGTFSHRKIRRNFIGQIIYKKGPTKVIQKIFECDTKRNEPLQVVSQEILSWVVVSSA